MMRLVQQTRFKVVIVGMALGLVEGFVKVAFPNFPLVETYGFQGAIVGAYLAARTVSGVKSLAMGNGSEEGEETKRIEVNGNGYCKEIPSDRPAVTMVMEKPE